MVHLEEALPVVERHASKSLVPEHCLGHRKRSVRMLDSVVEALARASLREHHAGPEDLVFGHPHKGTYLSQSTVYPRFVAACTTAGVRRVRFHDLRHTFATMRGTEESNRALRSWRSSDPGRVAFARVARVAPGGRPS